MSRHFLQTIQEGKDIESYLFPFLETRHGKLHEQQPSAVLDYKGSGCWVEIKSRSPEYTSTDKYSEGGWFVGYNKILKLLEIFEPVHIYYYFRGDKTLWLLTADKESLQGLKPFKNFQGKLTVKIPKIFFTQIPLA
jgi:hypothetical protein